MSATGISVNAQKSTTTAQATQNESSSAFIRFVNASNNATTSNENNKPPHDDADNDKMQCVYGTQQNKKPFSFGSLYGLNEQSNKKDGGGDDDDGGNDILRREDQVMTRGLA